MKKRRIAIDCDDVIVASAPAIVEHYNKTYGTQLALSDMYTENLEHWGVPDIATAINRVDAYCETNEFLTLPPLQEAIDTIQRLSQDHELHIITGRPDTLTEATNHMLQKYFPDIFQSVEFTNYITLGGVKRAKSQVCQERNIDLFIDDHLHHATIVAECGIEVLLFGNYPWNQTTTLPANIRRITGWKEIGEYLLA